MAIKQVVTIEGTGVFRAGDRVVIGTEEPVDPVEPVNAPYHTGYSPGVLFVEIVEDDE